LPSRAAQRFLFANPPCASREHKENCLECVFGIVLIVQHAAAHAEDHAPVSIHQRGEGPFVAIGDELLEQDNVRPLIGAL
jgi:hypothetical protein